MNIWNWIKCHPQRISGLLLTAFGSLQTSLALFQANLPPLWNAGITAGFGLIVTLLAWGVKNLKDEPLTEDTGDDTGAIPPKE